MVWEIKLFVVISEILLYDLKEYEETGGKLMKKPVLVVMAAGMGSRYGGLNRLIRSIKKVILLWIFLFMMQ